MREFIVILPGQISERLNNILKYSIKDKEFTIIKNSEEMTNMQNKRILFAIELGDTGINIELCKMLQKIKISGDNYFENSVGSIITNSNNEYFTRTVARQVILYANMAGCIFPGKPLSEATMSLRNLSNYKKINDIDLIQICYDDCKKTVDKLLSFKKDKIVNPHILVLHASNHKTSNTFTLWEMVKGDLKDADIKEIHIENGSVRDCKGCVYKECKHYSKSSNCFYGGIMVDEVYPAILQCDVLIMLCPNYNDAISANMSAVINRLTALYRKTKFYDKYLYAVIVSGHSGSDLLAYQLISALNINKTFMLPPNFAIMETANDIGAIKTIKNIEQKAEAFAENIKKYLIHELNVN